MTVDPSKETPPEKPPETPAEPTEKPAGQPAGITLDQFDDLRTSLESRLGEIGTSLQGFADQLTEGLSKWTENQSTNQSAPPATEEPESTSDQSDLIVEEPPPPARAARPRATLDLGRLFGTKPRQE